MRYLKGTKLFELMSLDILKYIDTVNILIYILISLKTYMMQISYLMQPQNHIASTSFFVFDHLPQGTWEALLSPEKKNLSTSLQQFRCHETCKRLTWKSCCQQLMLWYFFCMDASDVTVQMF